MSKGQKNCLEIALESTMGTPHPTPVAEIRALTRRLPAKHPTVQSLERFLDQIAAMSSQPYSCAATGHQWRPVWLLGWQGTPLPPPGSDVCMACGVVRAPVIPVAPSTERWVEYLPPFGERREAL